MFQSIPPQSPEFEGQAARVDMLAHEVLGATYVLLQTQTLSLHENYAHNKAEVTAHVVQTIGESKQEFDVTGEGVGLVDAYFSAMLKKFAPEYPTLSSITIADFSINTKLDGMKGLRSDAVANAVLVVRNSEGQKYAFSSRTPSISQSSVGVVQNTVRFFINSERAYIQLYLAREDAQKRSRSDLVERYQNQMATLVHATSYSVISKKILNGPC